MNGDRAPVRVIGVGAEFRHDDVAGLAVADLVAAAGLPDVEVHTTDGEPSRLIDAWVDARLAIVVDAVVTHRHEPGHVHRLLLGGDSFLLGGPPTTHGIGIGDAVALGQALGTVPERLVLYAIEVSDVSLGVGMNDPVRASVRAVAAAVTAEALRAVEAV